MNRHPTLFTGLLLIGACRGFYDFAGADDLDGDSYFGNADAVGFELELDCDDEDPSVHPHAADACNSGVDEDCVEDEDCFAWAAGPATLDPARSRSWSSDAANARLGSAIASLTVDGDPVALVSAPYASGGSVRLIPWSADEGQALAGAGGVLRGPAGAQLGAAMLPGVESGDAGFVALGAPAQSREEGAVYLLDEAQLYLDMDLDLSGQSPVYQGAAPVGGALAWSSSLRRPGAAFTLIAGDSDVDGDSPVVLLSCVTGASAAVGCEQTAQLEGDPYTGFGAALAVIEAGGGLLAVAAPGADALYFYTNDLLDAEDDRAAPALSIGLEGYAGQGVVLQAVDLRPEETAGEDRYPNLLLGLPAWDSVFLLDGQRLLELAGGGGASLDLLDVGLTLHRWQGEAGSGFGSALAGAEDLDGDGLPDLLVGAPTGGDTGQGEVWIFQSRFGDLWDDGLAEVPRVQGGPDDAHFGAALAVAPSMNADPYPELLIGAPMRTYLSTYAGTLYVALGNGE